MGSRGLGFVFCGLAMVTVATIVIAAKLIGQGLPPFTAAVLRFSLALPVFAVWMAVVGHRLPRLDRASWLLLTVQAALGSVGYMVLVILGTRLTSAATAGVISGSLTAMVALLAWIALGERPQRAQVLAIGLALVGVGLVTAGEGVTLSADALLGNGLILSAVAAEAAFLLLNKRLRAPIPPVVQSALMTGLGLLLSVPGALWEQAWLTPVSDAALLSVVWYAAVPTVLGFVFWYAGAARLSGAEAALATAVLPVASLALAAIVLGEAIAPAQVLGMLAVLVAVVVGSRLRG